MSWSNYLINKEVWKYTQLLTAYRSTKSITTRTGHMSTTDIDKRLEYEAKM